MRKSKFTSKQIVSILNDWQSGQHADDSARKHGIKRPTLYAWPKKYGGMETINAINVKF